MFRTVMLGSNDLEQSKSFYDAVMGVMGIPPAQPTPHGSLPYRKDGVGLVICRPRDGNPATQANGGTINLKMDSAEQVQAWHDAGVANGGTSIEDPPGIRHYPGQDVFSAYLRSPEGHKFTASYFIPA
jgi:catechol 2,3-dioxygenase-like lactoylglutathione lyase family enzyme